MSEILDIVDGCGEPTGKTVDRETAHRDGILHRTSHVWLVRLGMLRQMQVLVQKRAADKDAFPGCWDVSSAGHIPAGDDWVASALRELKEELGVEAGSEELLYLGKHRVVHDGVFHGKPFRNRQISAVFAMRCDKRAAEFEIQKSEIESVEWADLDDCIEVVRKNALPNCISLRELKWIKKKVWLYPEGEGPYRSRLYSAFKGFVAGLFLNIPTWFALIFALSCLSQRSHLVRWWLVGWKWTNRLPLCQLVALPVVLFLWGLIRPRVYRFKPDSADALLGVLCFVFGCVLNWIPLLISLWEAIPTQYAF